MRRDGDREYRRMICSARWRRLRAYVLNRHPLCARCLEEGRARLAEEVHHVRPVCDAAGPHDMELLMFDPSNLVALCHDCHVRAHTEMGRGVGKESARRVAASRLEDFKKKFP